MNDPISLIINSSNRATKRPAKVLGEILAPQGCLGVHGRASEMRLRGDLQAAKRLGPLNAKYFGSAELVPRHGSLTKEDQVNKDSQH